MLARPRVSYLTSFHPRRAASDTPDGIAEALASSRPPNVDAAPWITPGDERFPLAHVGCPRTGATEVAGTEEDRTDCGLVGPPLIVIACSLHDRIIIMPLVAE